MAWLSACWQEFRLRRGQQLRGRELNGAAEERVWGAAHGEGGGSGHALVEVTQWHHSGRTTPWRRGWALACCKPPPSLRLEKAGRLIRLRGDSISPGLRIHSPGLQIHAHTACRVPLPLSPISDEEVDDGGCAGVSRGRLTRGDMANADRSSRPSLPCPPEVWPSQPARRSEPTRTRPTVFSSPPPHLSPPTSTHPSVRLHRTMSLCGTSRVCVPECPPLGRPSF